MRKATENLIKNFVLSFERGASRVYVWSFADNKACSAIPGPLGKADSLPAGQHISRMLWNTVHYRVYKSPLLSVFFTRWLHSTYSHPVSIRRILILSSLLRVHLTIRIFFAGWLSKILQFPPCILYASPTTPSLIWSCENYSAHKSCIVFVNTRFLLTSVKMKFHFFLS